MKAEEKTYLQELEEKQKREWNKATLAHIKKIREIEKPSPMFPKTISKACEEYLNLCEEDGIKPSVAGLAFALGVSREVLLQWVRGEISVECADIVKYYFSILEIFDETALKDNKTNAVAGIFLGKNNYGYKDQVEHKIVSDKEMTNEEIERKYRQRHGIINQEVKELDIVEAVVNEPSNNANANDDDDIPF